MEWTNDMALEFLRNYEKEPVLWDPKDPRRKKKCFVYEAWGRVQENLSWKCDVEVLKKKKDSLMAYYRSHCNKIKKLKSEPGGDNVYATSWFAFETMHSFLGRVYDLECEKTYMEEVPFKENVSRLVSTDSDSTTDSQPTTRIQITPGKRKFQIANNCADESSIINLEPPQTDRTLDRTNEEVKSHCEMYGALLAHKLQLLNEEERLILMNQIDNLVFETALHVSKKKRED